MHDLDPSHTHPRADPLLVNPALFSDTPPAQQLWGAAPATRGCELLLQYLDLVDKYPTPPRMVRAHVHKLLGDWLQVRIQVSCINSPFLI